MLIWSSDHIEAQGGWTCFAPLGLLTMWRGAIRQRRGYNTYLGSRWGSSDAPLPMVMTTRLSIFQDPVGITNLNANFAQRSYLLAFFSVIRRHLRGFRGHKMAPDANSLSAAFMGYEG